VNRSARLGWKNTMHLLHVGGGPHPGVLGGESTGLLEIGRRPLWGVRRISVYKDWVGKGPGGERTNMSRRADEHYLRKRGPGRKAMTVRARQKGWACPARWVTPVTMGVGG